MLLSHAWISNLGIPITIAEVDDEDTSNEEAPYMAARYDKEVAGWVADALEKRNVRIRAGGKMDLAKPALHAAPLDAVSSPTKDGIPKSINALWIAHLESKQQFHLSFPWIVLVSTT